MSNRTVTVRPFGCVATIVSLFVLWALVFGVTFDGTHYGAGCSCDKGVAIDKAKVSR